MFPRYFGSSVRGRVVHYENFIVLVDGVGCLMNRLQGARQQLLLVVRRNNEGDHRRAAAAGSVDVREAGLRLLAAKGERMRNIRPRDSLASASEMTSGGLIRITLSASGPSRWMPSPPSSPM